MALRLVLPINYVPQTRSLWWLLDRSPTRGRLRALRLPLVVPMFPYFTPSLLSLCQSARHALQSACSSLHSLQQSKVSSNVLALRQIGLDSRLVTKTCMYVSMYVCALQLHFIALPSIPPIVHNESPYLSTSLSRLYSLSALQSALCWPASQTQVESEVSSIAI